jgi:protein subunit release factor B
MAPSMRPCLRPTLLLFTVASLVTVYTHDANARRRDRHVSKAPTTTGLSNHSRYSARSGNTAEHHQLVAAAMKPGALNEKFIKGSGAGGQKRNKTSSTVKLKHQPTGLVVEVDAGRSQSANRRIARQRLEQKMLAHLAAGFTLEQKAPTKTQRKRERRAAEAASHAQAGTLLPNAIRPQDAAGAKSSKPPLHQYKKGKTKSGRKKRKSN